jgi:hypothetical protein
MNDKKQSSIEWLEEQYYESEGKLTRHDFEQAKQMEKEQIIDAWTSAAEVIMKIALEEKEEYYNETYGGNNE